MKCKTCIETRLHNLPFSKNNRVKAKHILDIIYTDICGSIKTAGINGERYFVSFIDDYSKIAKVYCIKSKGEVFNCLVQFIKESENLTGKRVKMYVHVLNGTAELIKWYGALFTNRGTST